MLTELASVLLALALRTPAAAVTVAVDPGASRHAISPLVYGVNFGDSAQAAALRWPARRWGGNSTTRYSWQDDIANHASDWFFYNIESQPDPGTLPDGSTADLFVDDTRSSGGEPILTVPLIGWTPTDRVRRWGFSVAEYGVQQQTECTVTGNPPWCQPDAGNGNHTDGSPITGNDPHDTSREIGPDFVTGWMAHVAATRRIGGIGRRALLRPRQRAGPLELDAPRRPPGAAVLRRDLAAHRRLRLRDQDRRTRMPSSSGRSPGAGARTSGPRSTAAATAGRTSPAHGGDPLPRVVPPAGRTTTRRPTACASSITSTSTTTRRPGASRSRDDE